MLAFSQSVWPSTMVNQKRTKHSKTIRTEAPKAYQHRFFFSRSIVYTEVTERNFQNVITRKDFSILNTSASLEFEIIYYFPTATNARIICTLTVKVKDTQKDLSAFPVQNRSSTHTFSYLFIHLRSVQFFSLIHNTSLLPPIIPVFQAKHQFSSSLPPSHLSASFPSSQISILLIPHTLKQILITIPHPSPPRLTELSLLTTCFPPAICFFH